MVCPFWESKENENSMLKFLQQTEIAAGCVMPEYVWHCKNVIMNRNQQYYDTVNLIIMWSEEYRRLIILSNTGGRFYVEFPIYLYNAIDENKSVCILKGGDKGDLAVFDTKARYESYYDFTITINTTVSSFPVQSVFVQSELSDLLVQSICRCEYQPSTLCTAKKEEAKEEESMMVEVD